MADHYADPRIADAAPVVIQRGLTSELYFALPPSSQPQNLIDGLLYASPHPTEEHEDAVYALAEAMAEAGSEGASVYVARPCWLGDATVLQPDAAYLSAARANLAGRFLRGAPDVAVEVMSIGTRAFDEDLKAPAYAAAGVRELWLVDPVERAVRVFANDGGGWRPDSTVWFGGAIQSAIVGAVGTAALE
jgi:Uma2 family endonuclease